MNYAQNVIKMAEITGMKLIGVKKIPKPTKKELEILEALKKAELEVAKLGIVVVGGASIKEIENAITNDKMDELVIKTVKRCKNAKNLCN
jgi:vacuolar-type H+-ATPase subunit F/Vma7